MGSCGGEAFQPIQKAFGCKGYVPTERMRTVIPGESWPGWPIYSPAAQQSIAAVVVGRRLQTGHQTASLSIWDATSLGLIHI